MEELNVVKLIFNYIDKEELRIPDFEKLSLSLDSAELEEESGTMHLYMTSNFRVPPYVLDVTAGVIKQRLIANMPQLENVVERVDFIFNFEHLIEPARAKVSSSSDDPFGSMKIANLRKTSEPVTITGQVLFKDIRQLKTGKALLILHVTDFTETILVKKFMGVKQKETLPAKIHPGCIVTCQGHIEEDRFEKEMVFMAGKIAYAGEAEDKKRQDTAPYKRIELHAHTKMSRMDGLPDAKDLVNRAYEWGHEAVAITDHGVVQSFPDAMHAAEKKDIKVIYGMEGYLINDDTVGEPMDFNGEFVVFDIETTGFSPVGNEIIEIGAVRVKDRQILDSYDSFVKPVNPIPDNIVQLTDITNEMVADARPISEVLPEFLSFVGDAVVVAHNADFDVSFIRENASRLNIPFKSKDLDTIYLAKVLLPEQKKFGLKALTKYFNIVQQHHHRADDDAKNTALVLLRLFDIMKEAGYSDINRAAEIFHSGIDYKSRDTNHIIILAKNKIGLKNLYKLVSESHLKYFHNRKPRIPKSVLTELREGLIIGGACQDGEVFQSILKGKSPEVQRQIASYYDYLEIQPRENNSFLVNEGRVESELGLIRLNKRVVELGEELNKPVVATSDVHYMEPEDAVYRQILMKGQGFADVEGDGGLYFRSTNEMLDEFAYLGEEKAMEVVVDNPKLIADQIEAFDPVPAEKYPPKIENSEEDLRRICYDKAHSIYGDDLPEIVDKRLERELNSIINNGYSVMYIIAHKLVAKSMSDGYVVGSRGSVGSSFAATMSGITEVNPLPPHYICPNCKHSDFSPVDDCDCGVDLPDAVCPVCGTPYLKDGFDIPFEVFLGFNGDKEPDIDLNFAGEYQPVAHKYIEELFGEGHVFRAGTIGTVAEKTAYGYVKKFFEDYGKNSSKWETERLSKGCVGVKRTTGQHPGGIIVVPKENDIHEFCPVQHPADDTGTDIITTHFDYHSIDSNLLKLDILGHDGPSIIKMLYDITGIDPNTVPLKDERVDRLFLGTDSLGLKDERFTADKGSLGIPEFGTRFVRQMLEDTKPKSFADLVRIAGLSHGTDVWLNNAQEFILDGTCELKDVISVRDDILNYLQKKGVESSKAFKIMEGVRKGKGVKPDDVEIMEENNVPPWYIESCQRIKYMFPKAHAVAYVTMSYRIAYFKVYYPLAFYATHFTMKLTEFNSEVILAGPDAILSKIKSVETLGKAAPKKDQDSISVLELALEMYSRGYDFLPIDLKLSDAVKFKVVDGKVLPPFAVVEGVGENAARSLAEEVHNGEFLSVDDLKKRTKLNRTAIAALQDAGVFSRLPQTNQLSLFDNLF